MLDTTAAVAHLRQQIDVGDLVPHGTPLFMPIVVLGELYYGAERSARPSRNRHEIEIFLPSVILMVPDTAVALCYGKIAAKLSRAGKPIPTNDMWIAAAALTAGLPLAAREGTSITFLDCS